MVTSDKRDQIVALLHAFEEKHNIRILYAVESGSRAWGFPSKDSDYDVRFIYARPIDWYLSHRIENKSDNFESTIGDIDMAGWDIKKALGLYAKSNPPLLEWLDSPIVYINEGSLANQLISLTPEFYSAIACAYHYFHMAKGNYKDYLLKDRVRLKKYFYVLRPIFAVSWIQQGLGVVPMAFSKLLDIVDDQELLASIQQLIERKASGEEIDNCEHISTIKSYLDKEIGKWDVELKAMKPTPRDYDLEKLDDVFRRIVKQN